MTFQQAESCFDKYVLGRWTGWKPTEMERTDWILTLQRFTEDAVKVATFKYTQSHELYKKPKLPLLITLLNLNSGMKKEYRDAPLLFWLIRQRDGTMKPMYGVTGKTYTLEEIKRIAGTTAKRYSPDYQGDYWNPLHSRDEHEWGKYPRGRFPVNAEVKEEPVAASEPAEEKSMPEMAKDLFRPDKKIDDNTTPTTEYVPNPDWVGENPPPPEDGDIPF